MQTKKRNRSDTLPPYRSWARTKLLEIITGFPDYVKSVEKGYHFFTQEELANLRSRYSDGLTWEDIDRELSCKGILFKKGTFRKYIQANSLPRAVGYRKRENGRVAIFPADTISHINFILYFFKVADRTSLDEALELIGKISPTSTDYECVTSMLEDYPSPEAAINHYVSSDGDDGDIINAIEKAFATRPDDTRKALAELNAINKSYHDRVEKLVSSWKEHTVAVLLETADLETADEKPAGQPDQG